jgi:hypothetical protein
MAYAASAPGMGGPGGNPAGDSVVFGNVAGSIAAGGGGGGGGGCSTTH